MIIKKTKREIRDGLKGEKKRKNCFFLLCWRGVIIKSEGMTETVRQSSVLNDFLCSNESQHSKVKLEVGRKKIFRRGRGRDGFLGGLGVGKV